MKVEIFRVVGTGKNGEPIYAEQPDLPVRSGAVPLHKPYGVPIVDLAKIEASRRRKVELIAELRSRVGAIVDEALENAVDYVEMRRALIEVLDGAHQALLSERDQQRRGVKSEAFVAWEKARAVLTAILATPQKPHKVRACAKKRRAR